MKQKVLLPALGRQRRETKMEKIYKLIDIYVELNIKECKDAYMTVYERQLKILVAGSCFTRRCLERKKEERDDGKVNEIS